MGLLIFAIWHLKRRQKEVETKNFENEIEKRVQQIIDKRLALELEKQKESIEAEIQRRVAESRRLIEKEMNEELERQKQIEFKRQLEKEVCTLDANLNTLNIFCCFLLFKHHKLL